MEDLEVYVLPRVHQRHPEIDEDDVITALSSLMVEAQREDGTWMAVGLDGRGRNLEILYQSRDELIVVYHAFAPPTKKFMHEIAQLRRKQ